MFLIYVFMVQSPVRGLLLYFCFGVYFIYVFFFLLNFLVPSTSFPELLTV